MKYIYLVFSICFFPKSKEGLCAWKPIWHFFPARQSNQFTSKSCSFIKEAITSVATVQASMNRDERNARSSAPNHWSKRYWNILTLEWKLLHCVHLCNNVKTKDFSLFDLYLKSSFNQATRISCSIGRPFKIFSLEHCCYKSCMTVSIVTLFLIAHFFFQSFFTLSGWNYQAYFLDQKWFLILLIWTETILSALKCIPLII